MAECINTEALEAHNEKYGRGESPLIAALKTHLESYKGLLEPRKEIADVILRPSSEKS